MTVHTDALVAIAVMAIITYALRAGGYWLMGRIKLSPRIEAALNYLPGAVITALVVPAALEAGVAGVVGVGVVGIAMRWRGNLLLALVVGIGTVWVLRQLY